MSKNVRNAVIVLGILVGTSGMAETADSLGEAIREGQASIQLRLGFEYSSTDDALAPARGLNLRLRLGYRTAEYRDTSAFIQFHGLANLVEDFRFPGGGEAGRDVIGDPDGERVHQAYVDYTGVPDTRLRLGRQEIVLDDARLIGNVNWRQNGQSFDAVSFSNQSIPGLTLYGALIGQVNTIFLTHVDLDHLILLNARYAIDDQNNLTAFSYLLDTEISTPTAQDSATYGVRANGQLADIVRYDIAYAYQGDYQDGKRHNGDMINAFVGLNLEAVGFGIGYNRISGQDGKDLPFSTLYSTAHKFNGWADQFLATNAGTLAGGLEDVYVQVGTSILDAKVLLRYHMFDTTENSAGGTRFDKNYGDEIDLDITRGITENLTGQIRLAYYNETDGKNTSNPTTDEEVAWLRLLYKY